MFIANSLTDLTAYSNIFEMLIFVVGTSLVAALVLIIPFWIVTLITAVILKDYFWAFIVLIFAPLSIVYRYIKIAQFKKKK